MNQKTFHTTLKRFQNAMFFLRYFKLATRNFESSSSSCKNTLRESEDEFCDFAQNHTKTTQKHIDKKKDCYPR